MARKKKSARKRGRPIATETRKTRIRLSAKKKFAIARVHLAGIPASHLAYRFKISQLSVYQWARAVKKAGGKNPFGESDGLTMTPKQKRLMLIALRTK